ncbi:alkaline phosphatase family protein [Mycobacterium intracellulare subsp. chimaera]|nr:acid phosphatase [Mycobacterium intracellulare subsp. chimaera]MCA2350753.1 acid phosphatase [Mycobacterium intracellulare subsp. chimaera]MCV7324702.1 acid phosphatase [Mycobacterium intracellulare subsp. chimaera]UCN06880.1 alkaline phosphatase family protein [Mycobacterium intracellulare subsp. chimaera]UCN12413.1 alkaline phosphatase family protein [Mycobacterium intracellulare subsp. chimaera]
MLALGVVALVALAASPLTPRIGLAAAAIPQPAHIVIVVEENRSENGIIGNKSAPFITSLAANGANMTQSYAETHPSEPNYLALFAGNTFGVTKDLCPINAGAAPNLGSELLAAGRTFVGFAEGLPTVGSPVCTAGKYARKHVPWANFTNVPAANSMPFSAFPMRNYASLPTVSFVIPNNDNNMHDGSIAQADAWLNRQLSGYANWAVANNSLLILTFDEDDNGSHNQIPTVFYGAHVRPGNYSEQINHYNVLSTVEQMYGLPKTGYAASAAPITDIWG